MVIRCLGISRDCSSMHDWRITVFMRNRKKQDLTWLSMLFGINVWCQIVYMFVFSSPDVWSYLVLICRFHAALFLLGVEARPCLVLFSPSLSHFDYRLRSLFWMMFTECIRFCKNIMILVGGVIGYLEL